MDKGCFSLFSLLYYILKLGQNMYQEKIYHHPHSVEHHFTFAGNYGARGEKRAPKKTKSTEAVKRYNQILKARKMMRLIEDNFEQGDYWLTLKYKAGTHKPSSEVKEDIRKFIRKVREIYKPKFEMKFIYRIEIGKRGGIHFHMILNRGPNKTSDINRVWREIAQGNIEFEYLYNKTDFGALAAYIVKAPEEEAAKQLSFIPKDEQKQFMKYSTSRNLARPDPEVKKFSRHTMRKIFANDLKPAPGFAIDKDSIRKGFNVYTGMAYLYYREVQLTKGAVGYPVKLCECPFCHQFTLDKFRCDCRERMRKRGRR